MLLDYHLHTHFSADVPDDTGATASQICERAIELGLDAVAITDHYDADNVYIYKTDNINFEEVAKEVLAAKEKYAGKVNLLLGIEFAQAAHAEEQSRALLDRLPFDFVLGSVHAVRNSCDFYSVDYENASDEKLIKLFETYLYEMNEMIDLFPISSLAHISYPYRYYKGHGKDGVIKFKEKKGEYFEPILKKIVEKGIALEVNTSGLRQGLGETLPDTKLIQRYKELGGELITVGSDAHYLKDLGSNVAETFEVLKALGFKYITTFKERKPFPVLL